MDKNEIIKWVAIAGGVYAVYWYITNHGPNGAVYAADGTTKLNQSYWDSWFGTTSTTTTSATPTIGSDVMDPTELTAYVSAAQKAGKTNTQIQADLNSLATLKSQCASPNHWDTIKYQCIAAAGGGGGGAGGGSTTTTATTLRANLLAAAGATPTTLMNADNWNYYRNNLLPPALTPAQFGNAFPNMTATDRGPAITVDQFLAALQVAGGTGLSGFYGYGGGMGDIVPVPSVSSAPTFNYGGAAGSPGSAGGFFQTRKKVWS